MDTFTYEAQPGRVVFGPGSIERLPEEAERLGVERALVLSTPGQGLLAERAAALLGWRAVKVLADAVMHVPIETAIAAREEARRLGADAAIAIGGGSTIGLAKAIALETNLSIIAIPTTYAGSEMTSIWGLTEGGEKRTGRDPRVLPRCVIYDPVLTLGLPPQISGTSGMNAIAHCVEALYAPNRNPIIELMAEEGIRGLAGSLPAIIQNPADLEARSGALYGAWMAGAALGTATLGLHHKLCHMLGGSFNLPHAEVHTVILPHAAAYNAPAAPEAMARVARALGADRAPQALFDLARALGAPAGLRDLGMQYGDLDRAADLATRNPYPNPAPLSRAGIRELLEGAYEGRRPS
jgi:maleylacetate reductase